MCFLFLQLNGNEKPKSIIERLKDITKLKVPTEALSQKSPKGSNGKQNKENNASTQGSSREIVRSMSSIMAPSPTVVDIRSASKTVNSSVCSVGSVKEENNSSIRKVAKQEIKSERISPSDIHTSQTKVKSDIDPIFKSEKVSPNNSTTALVSDIKTEKSTSPTTNSLPNIVVKTEKISPGSSNTNLTNNALRSPEMVPALQPVVSLQPIDDQLKESDLRYIIKAGKAASADVNKPLKESDLRNVLNHLKENTKTDKKFEQLHSDEESDFDNIEHFVVDECSIHGSDEDNLPDVMEESNTGNMEKSAKDLKTSQDAIGETLDDIGEDPDISLYEKLAKDDDTLHDVIGETPDDIGEDPDVSIYEKLAKDDETPHDIGENHDVSIDENLAKDDETTDYTKEDSNDIIIEMSTKCDETSGNIMRDCNAVIIEKSSTDTCMTTTNQPTIIMASSKDLKNCSTEEIINSQAQKEDLINQSPVKINETYDSKKHGSFCEFDKRTDKNMDVENFESTEDKSVHCPGGMGLVQESVDPVILENTEILPLIHGEKEGKLEIDKPCGDANNSTTTKEVNKLDKPCEDAASSEATKTTEVGANDIEFKANENPKKSDYVTENESCPTHESISDQDQSDRIGEKTIIGPFDMSLSEETIDKVLSDSPEFVPVIHLHGIKGSKFEWSKSTIEESQISYRGNIDNLNKEETFNIPIEQTTNEDTPRAVDSPAEDDTTREEISRAVDSPIQYTTRKEISVSIALSVEDTTNEDTPRVVDSPGEYTTNEDTSRAVDFPVEDTTNEDTSRAVDSPAEDTIREEISIAIDVPDEDTTKEDTPTPIYSPAENATRKDILRAVDLPVEDPTNIDTLRAVYSPAENTAVDLPVEDTTNIDTFRAVYLPVEDATRVDTSRTVDSPVKYTTREEISSAVDSPVQYTTTEDILISIPLPVEDTTNEDIPRYVYSPANDTTRKDIRPVDSPVEDTTNEDTPMAVVSPVEDTTKEGNQRVVDSPGKYTTNEDTPRAIDSPGEDTTNEDTPRAIYSPGEDATNEDTSRAIDSPDEDTTNIDTLRAVYLPATDTTRAVDSPVKDSTREEISIAVDLPVEETTNENTPISAYSPAENATNEETRKAVDLPVEDTTREAIDLPVEDKIKEVTSRTVDSPVEETINEYSSRALDSLKSIRVHYGETDDRNQIIDTQDSNILLKSCVKPHLTESSTNEETCQINVHSSLDFNAIIGNNNASSKPCSELKKQSIEEKFSHIQKPALFKKEYEDTEMSLLDIHLHNNNNNHVRTETLSISHCLEDDDRDKFFNCPVSFRNEPIAESPINNNDQYFQKSDNTVTTVGLNTTSREQVKDQKEMWSGRSCLGMDIIHPDDPYMHENDQTLKELQEYCAEFHKDLEREMDMVESLAVIDSLHDDEEIANIMLTHDGNAFQPVEVEEARNILNECGNIDTIKPQNDSHIMKPSQNVDSCQNQNAIGRSIVAENNYQTTNCLDINHVPNIDVNMDSPSTQAEESRATPDLFEDPVNVTDDAALEVVPDSQEESDLDCSIERVSKSICSKIIPEPSPFTKIKATMNQNNPDENSLVSKNDSHIALSPMPVSQMISDYSLPNTSVSPKVLKNPLTKEFSNNIPLQNNAVPQIPKHIPNSNIPPRAQILPFNQTLSQPLPPVERLPSVISPRNLAGYSIFQQRPCNVIPFHPNVQPNLLPVDNNLQQFPIMPSFPPGYAFGNHSAFAYVPPVSVQQPPIMQLPSSLHYVGQEIPYLQHIPASFLQYTNAFRQQLESRNAASLGYITRPHNMMQPLPMPTTALLPQVRPPMYLPEKRPNACTTVIQPQQVDRNCKSDEYQEQQRANIHASTPTSRPASTPPRFGNSSGIFDSQVLGRKSFKTILGYSTTDQGRLPPISSLRQSVFKQQSPIANTGNDDGNKTLELTEPFPNHEISRYEPNHPTIEPDLPPTYGPLGEMSIPARPLSVGAPNVHSWQTSLKEPTSRVRPSSVGNSNIPLRQTQTKESNFPSRQTSLGESYHPQRQPTPIVRVQPVQQETQAQKLTNRLPLDLSKHLTDIDHNNHD